MASDPELQLRGRLARSLLTLREMLPGSFLQRRRACGRPNCRCASGRPEDGHAQWALSVLWQGKLRTIHLDERLAEEARRGVELHRRFQQVEARILEINLRRLLRKKQAASGQGAATL
jgi:hypothetical protein